MKKKIIVISTIFIVFIVLCVFLFLNTFSSISRPRNVAITYYVVGDNTQLESVQIDSKEDMKMLFQYVKNIKPLSENEIVELALSTNIDIRYNDFISIGVQVEEKEYCYYTNTKTNESFLAKMPFGFYDWVMSKVDLSSTEEH